MEERKLKEIEHSDRRRQIVTGYEYLSDSEKAAVSKVADPTQFDQHFSNVKFYAIADISFAWRDGLLARHCPGKVCLDYCCGNGEIALAMAKLGAAHAHGIDLSPVAVTNATQLAKEAGVGDTTTYQVMDAEHTTYPNNHFDVIHVYGCLHHLDLPAAFAELARILKPSGIIVCTEALRHNPFIHWYRKRTPLLRTAWEVEHILGVPEICSARRWFDSVDMRFFHLCAIASVPLRKTLIFKPVLSMLNLCDAVLLRIPGLRRWAWQSIFTLSKPRKATKS
jgi:ubiquinone/menaquinone biosynthesis C-methylase UbiE